MKFQMTTRRGAAYGALAIAAAVAIAGCGSSSKSQTAQSGPGQQGFQGGPSGASGQAGRPYGPGATGASGRMGGPPGGPGGPGAVGGQGVPGGGFDQVKGAAGKKARAAALKKVNGTVVGVVKDQRTGGGYIVFVQAKDGKRTVVVLDKNYKVTNTQELPNIPQGGQPAAPNGGNSGSGSNGTVN